MKFEVDYKSL